MIGEIPFGGISATGNATSQAITTATTKLTFTGATNTPTTGTRVGDPAVKPDATNSRIQINAPGLYRVNFEGCGGADGALNCAFQLRKTVAGTQTALAGTKMAGLFSTTNKFNLSLNAIIEVLSTDLGTAGGASTFADPDATAGAGKPAGGFAGAGAAPKTGVYLDVSITGDASQALTLTDMRLTADRIG